MVVKHHKRDSSISSIGSWGSELGTAIEELSQGDDSISEQSSAVRVVTEMAILASSSPEIKALSRAPSFSQSFHSFQQQPSPCDSIASSIIGRDFAEAEESKCHYSDHEEEASSGSNTQNQSEQLVMLSFENLRIEPPPTPRREPFGDIASTLGSTTKENVGPDNAQRKGAEEEKRLSETGRKARRSFFRMSRPSPRESEGSSGSNPNGQRPPMPLKTPTSSMHRRVSFDSLPNPSEIGVSGPLVYSSLSEPSLKTFRRRSPCSSEKMPYLNVRSYSDRTLDSFHRRSPSMASNENASSVPSAIIYSSTSQRTIKRRHHRRTPSMFFPSMSSTPTKHSC